MTVAVMDSWQLADRHWLATRVVVATASVPRRQHGSSATPSRIPAPRLEAHELTSHSYLLRSTREYT